MLIGILTSSGAVENITYNDTNYIPDQGYVVVYHHNCLGQIDYEMHFNETQWAMAMNATASVCR
jgi:hypothetical protein